MVGVKIYDPNRGRVYVHPDQRTDLSTRWIDPVQYPPPVPPRR